MPSTTTTTNATNATTATLPPHHTPPPLPTPFTHTYPTPTLHYQGAEALLYRTYFLTPSLPAALKHRPSKPYRHPSLDAKLTRHRILAEARVLVKLRREGVPVPAVYALDWERGWMIMEWVEGGAVRWALEGVIGEFVNGRGGEGLKGLMGRIGSVVGRMHEVGVVHGDLTTSNLMLRPRGEGVLMRSEGSGAQGAGDERVDDGDVLEGEVVLIDFGLAAQSVQDEDRAVDLYVLERAFGSTHPRTEDLFQEVLKAYGASYKGAKVVLKRFEEVRTRGRKKIMIG